MFGLSGGVVVGFIILLAMLVAAIIYAVSGTYEGKKVEEEYEVEEWYHVL